MVSQLFTRKQLIKEQISAGATGTNESKTDFDDTVKQETVGN